MARPNLRENRNQWHARQAKGPNLRDFDGDNLAFELRNITREESETIALGPAHDLGRVFGILGFDQDGFDPAQVALRSG